ncbi:hypothetical protein BJ742DRAFT_851138 [Cladochytrium replicatum]|nr:hypothetical protein BJ742DRAFT_851138 [Cladochytrium replicatum]
MLDLSLASSHFRAMIIPHALSHLLVLNIRNLHDLRRLHRAFSRNHHLLTQLNHVSLSISSDDYLAPDISFMSALAKASMSAITLRITVVPLPYERGATAAVSRTLNALTQNSSIKQISLDFDFLYESAIPSAMCAFSKCLKGLDHGLEDLRVKISVPPHWTHRCSQDSGTAIRKEMEEALLIHKSTLKTLHWDVDELHLFGVVADSIFTRAVNQPSIINGLFTENASISSLHIVMWSTGDPLDANGAESPPVNIQSTLYLRELIVTSRSNSHSVRLPNIGAMPNLTRLKVSILSFDLNWIAQSLERSPALKILEIQKLRACCADHDRIEPPGESVMSRLATTLKNRTKLEFIKIAGTSFCEEDIMGIKSSLSSSSTCVQLGKGSYELV